MSRKPTENIDYTSRDYEAFRELLIQKLQEKMPEYTDTSETDAGIVILEALANGLDVLSLYLDIIANDVLLPTTQDRGIAVIIAKCLGYTPYNQTSAEFEQVFVLGDIRDSDTLIPQGTIVKTAESTDLATLYYETQEDLIIPANSLGNEKDENDNYIYTVKVKHGQTITQDVLGSSSGAPLQSFKLNFTQVLVDSLKLYVNEGQGQVLWEQVDNFIECDENSKVYTVSVDDFDVCTITFGNGLKGKIPTAYSNGIVANYRIGGGEVGNVNAGVINTLDSSVAYVDSTFNLDVSVRGHEKESLDSIKVNAPAAFRTRDRLVTLQDYSDLLRLNFYDFLDLVTLRDTVDKKLVHIFYMMKDGYTMSADLVSKIADYIADRSMVGTTYDLNPYVQQTVNITANMYVDGDYDLDELRGYVEDYITNYTFSYGNLKFGDSVVKSDLENEIKTTFEGILSFRISSPASDIIAPASEENVLTLGTLTINAQYL